MTDTLLTPELLALRRDLFAATTRDVEQRRLRHHPVRAIALALVAIVAVSGVAMAASPQFTRTVTDAGAAPLRSLGIFERDARPARDGDAREPELSQEAARRFAELLPARGRVPGAQYPGAFVTGKGRLAVSLRAEGYEVELYVTLTDLGQACTTGVLVAGGNGVTGTGGCIQALDPSWPVATQGLDSAQRRQALVGVVSDDVRAVRFETTLGMEQAVMGDNAFAYLAPDEEHPPIAQEVELRNGTVLRRTTPGFAQGRDQARAWMSCRDAAPHDAKRNVSAADTTACFERSANAYPPLEQGPVTVVAG